MIFDKISWYDSFYMIWLTHRYNLPNGPVPLGVVVPIPTSEMLCSVCPFTILVYAIIRGVGACGKGTDSRDVRAGWRVRGGGAFEETCKWGKAL
jgi:hypothetical protein